MDFTGERFVPSNVSDLLELEHRKRYEFACRYSRGKSVLDIACGSGYGSRMLLEAGAEQVTGVDISSEAIEYAVKNYGNQNLHFITSDAECYNSGKYDLIVSFETLEHLDRRQMFLSNLNTMLRNNGMLIISTPNKKITSPMKSPHKIRNKYHKYEYTQKEIIVALHEVGFRKILKFGQHLYPRIFNNQLISRLLRRRFNKDTLKTAEVSQYSNRTIPRYFVFVATK